jgi:hypothetical protein
MRNLRELLTSSALAAAFLLGAPLAAGAQTGSGAAVPGMSTGAGEARGMGEQRPGTEPGAAPRAGAGAADTTSGASSAPAPTGGGGAQATAASPAAGMPLARVSSIVGTNVVGANDRDAGEVQNLLIDPQGQVRAAVIEWGGFFGIGSRQAVVPIEQLRFGSDGDRIRMDLTREQLEQLPRYDSSRVADIGRDQGWGDGLRLHR